MLVGGAPLCYNHLHPYGVCCYWGLMLSVVCCLLSGCINRILIVYRILYMTRHGKKQVASATYVNSSDNRRQTCCLDKSIVDKNVCSITVDNAPCLRSSPSLRSNPCAQSAPCLGLCACVSASERPSGHLSVLQHITQTHSNRSHPIR